MILNSHILGFTCLVIGIACYTHAIYLLGLNKGRMQMVQVWRKFNSQIFNAMNLIKELKHPDDSDPMSFDPDWWKRG